MATRYFQTTPIYYVNDRPHLGTAYTMVVADALARWRRLCGDDVFFLTGTDEHGLKIQRAAEEQGLSPKAWTDRTSASFKRAWQALSIAYDDFIRTTEERHAQAVQRFVQVLYDRGYIYKGNYAGWYCVACEAYYGESELVAGQTCPVHAKPVEWLVEENYFFALSKFQDRLLEWYTAAPNCVRPETRRNEALSFIRQGLEDISISRTSISWGIPVPWDPAHVVYVWFDALVNYCSAVGFGSDDARFRAWWPSVHHLIGKDILRFHCVWWPAMCMAAGIEPPSEILVHGFLLVGGEKMSKSRANQIDPVALAEDVGVDALRYHLLREVTLGADGDFSYEALLTRYNSDLANTLGNLLSRVAAVVASKCGGIGPAPRVAGADAGLALAAQREVDAAAEAWDRGAPSEALEATWRLLHRANAALEASEPWKLPPGAEVDGALGDALEVLRLTAILIAPAMPEGATALWRRLGLSGPVGPTLAGGAATGLTWGGYPGGLEVRKGEPLFPRRQDAEAASAVSGARG